MKSTTCFVHCSHLQGLTSWHGNAGVVKSTVVSKEAIFRIGMGIEQEASAITRTRSIVKVLVLVLKP
jgi:hypothetical protein